MIFDFFSLNYKYNDKLVIYSNLNLNINNIDLLSILFPKISKKI